MNKKTCLPLFLVLSLAMMEIQCGPTNGTLSDREEAAPRAVSNQQASSPQNTPARLNPRTPGGGRSQGMGAARGRGRGWGRYDPITISESEGEAIEIETVKAAYKSMRNLHPAMGKVLAPQTKTAIVSYAFPARIADIHVRIGDWVKKGQLVLTLQSEEVGNAKSEYYKAIADHELAKANLEREKRLYDRGVGAQKNYQTTEAELKVAEANLEAAEKKLHVLGFSEEEIQNITDAHEINPTIRLFAPIGGKVVEHKAVLGAMIDQSSELLTLMDPTTLWIDAEIYERDIAKIRAGQNVLVSVPAYPDETFTGKISYISDKLNDETRTITVRSEVENSSYKLKPGMFADMRILLNHTSRALVLPSEAILDDNDDQIVFIKTDDMYMPQVVEVGVKENGLCEIRYGLNEGDEVVTKGNFQLKSKLYDELLGKAHVH